jgi:hypothetical protein
VDEFILLRKYNQHGVRSNRWMNSFYYENTTNTDRTFNFLARHHWVRTFSTTDTLGSIFRSFSAEFSWKFVWRNSAEDIFSAVKKCTKKFTTRLACFPPASPANALQRNGLAFSVGIVGGAVRLVVQHHVLPADNVIKFY